MKNRIERRSFTPSSDDINFFETIIKELKRKQFRMERRVYSMKERLTKDVRYQEFNEVTLDERSD